jgi:hypothetical protein
MNASLLAESILAVNDFDVDKRCEQWWFCNPFHSTTSDKIWPHIYDFPLRAIFQLKTEAVVNVNQARKRRRKNIQKFCSTTNTYALISPFLSRRICTNIKVYLKFMSFVMWKRVWGLCQRFETWVFLPFRKQQWYVKAAAGKVFHPWLFLQVNIEHWASYA